jgi:2-dehydro-3-deoxygalactonokinase
MSDFSTTKWIALDWGTSHLRAWIMGASGLVLDRRESDAGMGSLRPDQFEAALLDLISDCLLAGQVTPVIACGMAGSRQGWAEATYRAVPCDPPGAELMTRVKTADTRIQVHILPGVKQAKPADVMRGEETQIAGFLTREPKFDGVLCLPGTHSKWARISAGEIVSFQSYMTGEMFALLSEQSVLRHGMAGEGWNEDAFTTAIDDAMSRPQALAAQLFALRAGNLIADLDAASARARLSGLLIGVELAAARPYWLGQDIAVLGADDLAQAYMRALTAQGCFPRSVAADEMTLAGLSAAWNTLNGDTE